MRSSATVLVPLAVLAAGCGTAPTRDSSSDSAPPIEVVAPTKPTTPISGGTAKQRAVLRQILSGLGPTKVRSIEIAPEADGVALRARAHGLDDGFGLWEAKVVGDVFARRSLELHLQPVVWIEDETGGEATYEPDLSAALRKPPLTVAEAKNDLERVVEIAEQEGVTADVHLVRPDRPAFVIELRADDPARFLRDGFDGILEAIDEDPHRYDGRYVKVVDGQGKYVLEIGAGFGVRGELRACAHVITTGVLGQPDPPPCPAG